MTAPISIRRAETIHEYRACQRAQRAAWGIADDGYVVPLATMVGAQLHGGLVLGAFLPDGEAVGLSFAFLGRVEGRLCLYSQLTGVVPGHQDQGIGYRLKHAQREVARAEQVPCIAWAFDPLQAGNARFNLEKLGARAVRYVVDMYGARSDALNQNATTDRLIAVWEARDDDRPRRHPDCWRDLPRAVALDPDERAGPAFLGLPDHARAILIEVPSDVSRLRAERPEQASRWGQAVRDGFVAAFGAGFEAVGFVRDDRPEGRRCHYVLERPKGSSDQAS